MSALRHKPIDFAAEGSRLALSIDRNCGIRAKRKNLIWGETPQRGKDLGAEETDRAHQVFLSDGADIEFRQNCIEQPFRCGGFDLLDDGPGRANKSQIVL